MRHHLNKAGLAFLFLSVGICALWPLLPAFAQAATRDIGYVVGVKGRAIIISQGDTTPLDVLDTIDDPTEIELGPNSEVRICQYRSLKVLTLKGPGKASISNLSTTLDNGHEIKASSEACAKPVVSTVQGGAVFRDVINPAHVGLKPQIRIINQGEEKIAKISLLDVQNGKTLKRFKSPLEAPHLAEGRPYSLILEFANGRKWEMKLQASAAAGSDAVIITVQ